LAIELLLKEGDRVGLPVALARRQAGIVVVVAPVVGTATASDSKSTVISRSSLRVFDEKR
jgi:hypothetical protein